MTNHSFYSAICKCGKTNSVDQDGTAFVCSCGRKSVVDFSIGYTESELVEILNNLDRQRDNLARVIEIRRERKSA